LRKSIAPPFHSVILISPPARAVRGAIIIGLLRAILFRRTDRIEANCGTEATPPLGLALMMLRL
jgi:hypothetical protein